MIKKYFKTDTKGRVLFTGDRLDIYIPDRYYGHKVLDIQDVTSTLGIFSLIVNENIEGGLFIPSLIKIEHSERTNVTVEGIRQVKLTLYKNDVFMQSIKIIKNQSLAYIIFREFIMLGKLPKFIDYELSAFIINKVEDVTGVNFKANNIIFEIITSYLHRSKNNIMQPYRLTDMTEEPIVIPMQSVAHSATSVTGRLIGSNFNDTLNSTIVNKTDQDSRLEELLRQ